MRSLVWFRGKDLRVEDHAPLLEGVRAGEVVAVVVLEPQVYEASRAKEAARSIQFFIGSLVELALEFEGLGSSLLIALGSSAHVIPQLVERYKVDQVLAYSRSEPGERTREESLGRALKVPFRLMVGETLVPPTAVKNSEGSPFLVFSPFYRRLLGVITDVQVSARPSRIGPLPADVLAQLRAGSAGNVRSGMNAVPLLEELGLRPERGLTEPGSVAARARLKRFKTSGINDYSMSRDDMSREGTSFLSQDLRFGTLSVREVWNSVSGLPASAGRDAFLRQLGWREFAHHLLYHFPRVEREPFRQEFSGFPWRFEEGEWQAWQSGHTGYPLVDAAQRQLLATGVVHNRARMVTASFLTKHLLIDYRRGEAHYMRWLTDADQANNNLGWQWSAGTGTDAQPYFRVFNPTSQGQKFDASGAYVRRWVPELSKLPASHIHTPWLAPKAVLEKAGVVLERDYPLPIVEHGYARTRYLTTAGAHLAKAKARPAGGVSPAAF
ncbi:MAG: deoxyribodipyrimidine photo-lyase [Polyangiaceae bacterium]|nr:deoxyribodipyrimidine photo-lyase [Polyangiaceae bacterium]